ncbi:hypothetical protein Tco_1326607 [Tanacetum coccineum]
MTADPTTSTESPPVVGHFFFSFRSGSPKPYLFDNKFGLIQGNDMTRSFSHEFRGVEEEVVEKQVDSSSSDYKDETKFDDSSSYGFTPYGSRPEENCRPLLSKKEIQVMILRVVILIVGLTTRFNKAKGELTTLSTEYKQVKDVSDALILDWVHR